jgi:hypothetical protein
MRYKIIFPIFIRFINFIILLLLLLFQLDYTKEYYFKIYLILVARGNNIYIDMMQIFFDYNIPFLKWLQT